MFCQRFRPFGNNLFKYLLCESYKSTIQQVRQCNKRIKLLETEDFDSHPTTYQDTSVEYAIGKKRAIKKIQDLFNVQVNVAFDIATRFKVLQRTTGKTLSDNHDLLKNHGIEDELLLEYPSVLTQKCMQERIVLLKELPFELKETLPLLNILLHKLETFVANQHMECVDIPPGGRLQYYSKLFKLPLIKVCDVVAQRDFLLSINLEKVDTNHKLLFNYGITNNEILKDLWVLRYNTEKVKERLDVAKQLNLEKLKTWMVRAQSSIFDTYIHRISENKLILGENSLIEYLAERLECTIEQAKVILAKHPPLAGKSMKKLKEIIDFLYGDGYSPLHIVRNPKILLHSEETTRKRLKELQATGMKVDSLHILTKSQKQYMNYYENLVKSSKKKIKKAKT